MSICKDCIHNNVCKYGENRSNGMYCTGEKCKQYQSAADVSEVKHGYWFFTEYEYFTCSECGESYYNGSDYTAETRKWLEEGRYYPYCPHCGAKMDVEPPKRKERKNRDV